MKSTFSTLTFSYLILLTISGGICTSSTTDSTNVTNIAKANTCCQGEATIVGRNCTDGLNVGLTCEKMFILDPSMEKNELYRIDEDGQLFVPVDIYQESETVDKSQYCLGRKQKDGPLLAIVCFSKEMERNTPWYKLRAILGFVSVVFLVATLVVYYLVPELRDLQGKCIIHAITSLAISLLNLGIIQVTNLSANMCSFFSFFSYVSFMTTFFWLNVTSFHVWKTVCYSSMKGTDKQWYCIYLLYGHGAPLIFLMALLLGHHLPGEHLKPGIGEERCWFNGLTATWAYFYGPISVLLIINLILFVWSVRTLWIESKRIDDVKMKSLEYKVRLYLKLFVLMGIMWIFEVISAALDNVHRVLNYFWMVTDYINVLQGVFIFLLLVVCRKKALRGLANKNVCGIQFPSAWKSFRDEETIVPVDDEVERAAQVDS